jgi:hypothetical protein
MALVGNFVSCLRTKSEIESVTPDTAFRFNSKDNVGAGELLRRHTEIECNCFLLLQM